MRPSVFGGRRAAGGGGRGAKSNEYPLRLRAERQREGAEGKRRRARTVVPPSGKPDETQFFPVFTRAPARRPAPALGESSCSTLSTSSGSPAPPSRTLGSALRPRPPLPPALFLVVGLSNSARTFPCSVIVSTVAVLLV